MPEHHVEFKSESNNKKTSVGQEFVGGIRIKEFATEIAQGDKGLNERPSQVFASFIGVGWWSI